VNNIVKIGIEESTVFYVNQFLKMLCIFWIACNHSNVFYLISCSIIHWQCALSL